MKMYLDGGLKDGGLKIEGVLAEQINGFQTT